MKRKVTIMLVIGVMLSIIIAVSAMVNINNLKSSNDFTRLFPSHVAEFVARRSLGTHSKGYYISGAAERHIFLHRTDSADQVLSLNPELTENTTFIICHQSTPTDRVLSMQIKHGKFYLQNGRTRFVDSGNLSDWKSIKVWSEVPYFNAFQPISNSSAVFRIVSASTRQNALAKYVNNRTIHHPEILTKQVDGIFCTDGFLEYDDKSALVVYLYRYRNQFICMDTSLNVRYRANTIDTTSVAKLSLAEVNGSIMFSKPPPVVNRMAAVFDGYLFVNSSLQARNEDTEKFQNSQVIDVYDLLSNGRYKFSFYIKNYEGAKISGLKIGHYNLFTICGNYVFCYKLNEKLLARAPL